MQRQGYELAEEEVRISLDTFRDRFADASGAPEYVCLRSSPPLDVANTILVQPQENDHFLQTHKRYAEEIHASPHRLSP